MLNVLTSMLTPINLLMMNVGVAIGVIVGAMPGLNTIFAITVLLPFTFGLESTTGMYLLLGASCGGLFGGSISAILINTPGTPAACATVLDGYPMAQKGNAGNALRYALVASSIGGLLSCFALLFLAPAIANFALNFASPESFSLCIFGMATVIGLSEGKEIKGIIMAILGLLISTVGIDVNDGAQRFMFGNLNLLAGINSIVVMLGIFAMSEVLMKTRDHCLIASSNQQLGKITKATIKLRDILRNWKLLLKSSVIGIAIGAIPGTGGAMASMLAYNEARRSSSTPQEFGKGIPEGIMAPEAANNAVSGGALIPMLTLGIPGDATAAVLLGALTMQGITPGIALFTTEKTWVYAIMGGLFIINIFMLVQGLFFSQVFANLTCVPEAVLLPCIVILCTVGAFSVANTTFNVLLMIAFGFLGYILKRLDFPLPPLVVAMVLGSTLEQNLRRSLILSQGRYTIFFTKPISCTILVAAGLFLVYPPLKKYIKNHKRV